MMLVPDEMGCLTEGGLEGLLEYMEVKSVAKNRAGRNVPANFMRDVQVEASANARL